MVLSLSNTAIQVHEFEHRSDRAFMVLTGDAFTFNPFLTVPELEELAELLTKAATNLRKRQDDELNAKSEAMHKEHMKG